MTFVKRLFIVSSAALFSLFAALAPVAGQTPDPGQPPPENASPALTVWQKMFPKGIMDGQQTVFDANILEGKMVGVYFAARWCSSCKAFTPKMVKFRDAHVAEGFEVVMLSADFKPGDQFLYMKEFQMKWYTIPLNAPEANALFERYEVKAIPKLVVFSPKGNLVTTEGYLDLTSAPDTSFADWKKKAEELDEQPATPAPGNR